MRRLALPGLLFGSLLGGHATPATAQPSACRPPLKFLGGACVASCPIGYRDRGRACEQARNLSPEEFCNPPLKAAAGACVPSCPGGYEDRGRYCNLRSNN